MTIKYTWNSPLRIGSKDYICGHCGRDISSESGYFGQKETNNGRFVTRKSITIHICHKCQRPTYHEEDGYQAPIYENAQTVFPDEIVRISPKFVKIFGQSEHSEAKSHDDIAGVGYGKAFEFLIKDYLIHAEPRADEKVKIKKETLHDCIQKRVSNEKIRKAAEKAKILRNDETHYEKIYTDKDVRDLKKLIQATVHWIEIDLLTEADL